MSNRSLLELNHDYSPQTEGELLQWSKDMMNYYRCADPAELPRGITRKYYRHHSEECPMEKLAKLQTTLSENRESKNERFLERF